MPQVTFDGKPVAPEEDKAPEIDVLTYLKYWNLKEDPTKGRDFVHTDLVNLILERVDAGRSVRLLGDAGIGKSATTREVKALLEDRVREKYVVTTVPLNSLVDPNNRFITKGGLTAIGLYVLDEFELYFEKHGRDEVLLSKVAEHTKALRSTSESIDAPVRTYHLTRLFEKAKDAEYKFVIVLDDADALQNFDSFDNLNKIIDSIHSAILCYKQAEERASKQRATMREDNEIGDEQKARKQRLDAFLRRSSSIPILGQPAKVVQQIVHGKLSKRADIFSDDALAYGLMAAYSSRAPPANSLGAYIAGLRPEQPLYNPGKIATYLVLALEEGCRRQVKQIGPDIAELAYRRTVANLDVHGIIDVPSLDEHLQEFRLAKAELAKEKS